eukprot:TRINITY_DN21570_c0_g1_i1.p1 TRINITY_DN21570_c0_g1~~TRINITY_DN21570_c0_g1_i1.p1  ORF type:complete len:283 (-),score=6.52 TRINITY_DN21570_c0_g1_i1:73-921(-)
MKNKNISLPYDCRYIILSFLVGEDIWALRTVSTHWLECVRQFALEYLHSNYSTLCSRKVLRSNEKAYGQFASLHQGTVFRGFTYKNQQGKYYYSVNTTNPYELSTTTTSFAVITWSFHTFCGREVFKCWLHYSPEPSDAGSTSWKRCPPISEFHLGIAKRYSSPNPLKTKRSAKDLPTNWECTDQWECTSCISSTGTSRQFTVFAWSEAVGVKKMGTTKRWVKELRNYEWRTSKKGDMDPPVFDLSLELFSWKSQPHCNPRHEIQSQLVDDTTAAPVLTTAY